MRQYGCTDNTSTRATLIDKSPRSCLNIVDLITYRRLIESYWHWIILLILLLTWLPVAGSVAHLHCPKMYHRISPLLSHTMVFTYQAKYTHTCTESFGTTRWDITNGSVWNMEPLMVLHLVLCAFCLCVRVVHVNKYWWTIPWLWKKSHMDCSNDLSSP